MKKYSKQELINFETKVANTFNEGKIRAPVHLYYGNEKEIIEVFERVNDEDWVLCSWRSHYQCLLKGVPEDQVFNKILDGQSISLCFPEFNIYSSAIVGGNIPVAVGIAYSLKMKSENSKVFCFIGDMTSETGIAHECIKYSINHDLPIVFVIENNGLSVCTETNPTWGTDKLSYETYDSDKIIFYKYKSKYPHAGAGERVQF